MLPVPEQGFLRLAANQNHSRSLFKTHVPGIYSMPVKCRSLGITFQNLSFWNIVNFGTKEMAQRLWANTAAAEHLSQGPSTHIRWLCSKQSNTLSGLHGHVHEHANRHTCTWLSTINLKIYMANFISAGSTPSFLSHPLWIKVFASVENVDRQTFALVTPRQCSIDTVIYIISDLQWCMYVFYMHTILPKGLEHPWILVSIWETSTQIQYTERFKPDCSVVLVIIKPMPLLHGEVHYVCILGTDCVSVRLLSLWQTQTLWEIVYGEERVVLCFLFCFDFVVVCLLAHSFRGLHLRFIGSITVALV